MCDIKKPVTISIGQTAYIIGGLGNWVTFQQYAELFGLKSVNIIYNWIAREVVSSCHWVEIPELGVKLIKAQTYGNKKAGRPRKAV
jgi:hypothetical protein